MKILLLLPMAIAIALAGSTADTEEQKIGMISSVMNIDNAKERMTGKESIDFSTLCTGDYRKDKCKLQQLCQNIAQMLRHLRDELKDGPETDGDLIDGPAKKKKQQKKCKLAMNCPKYGCACNCSPKRPRD